MLENTTQRFVGVFGPPRAEEAAPAKSLTDASAESAQPSDAAESTRAGRLRAALFVAGVVVVLRVGRQATDAGYLTPEAGLGYAFGVAGAVIMLALLLYPVRKRWLPLQRWGAVRHWFRIHMILGIVGPVFIALHCGMRPGASNSRIALVAMLLVVGSGIVGRYIYARIHHGLYGSRATLVELSLELAASRSRLVEGGFLTHALRDRLLHLGEAVDSHPHDVFGSGFQALSMSIRSRALGAEMFLRLLVAGWGARQGAFGATRTARSRVREYLASVRLLAGFAFYERLFALWHMLHVPLFVLLLASGVAHVIAVHLY